MLLRRCRHRVPTSPPPHLAAALVGDAHPTHVFPGGAGLDAQLRNGVDCGRWDDRRSGLCAPPRPTLRAAGSAGGAGGAGRQQPRASSPLGLSTEAPQLVSQLM